MKSSSLIYNFSFRDMIYLLAAEEKVDLFKQQKLS